MIEIPDTHKGAWLNHCPLCHAATGKRKALFPPAEGFAHCEGCDTYWPKVGMPKLEQSNLIKGNQNGSRR